MRIFLGSLIAASLSLISCMEGPAGRDGRDGAGSNIQDSIIIDLKSLWIFYNSKFYEPIPSNQNYIIVNYDSSSGRSDTILTTFELSINLRAYYSNSDTSMLLYDSISRVFQGQIFWEKMLFARSQYTPKSWNAILEVSNNHSCSFSDTVPTGNWLSLRTLRIIEHINWDTTYAEYRKCQENTNIPSAVLNDLTVFEYVLGKGFNISAPEIVRSFGNSGINEGKLKIYYK